MFFNQMSKTIKKQLVYLLIVQDGRGRGCRRYKHYQTQTPTFLKHQPRCSYKTNRKSRMYLHDRCVGKIELAKRE